MANIKRYNIYAVSGDKGWEARVSAKGAFVSSVTFDQQMKKMQDVIRGLLIVPEPGVHPEEAKTIYKEARRAAGLPETKEK